MAHQKKKTSPAAWAIIAAIGALLAIAANKTAWQIAADKAAGHDAGYLIEHAFDDLADPWPILHLGRIPLGASLIAIALLALALLYKWATAGNYRHGEEHGSAEWGSPADFKPFEPKTPKAEKGKPKPTKEDIKEAKKQGLIFTRQHTLALDTHQTRRNLNALVIGSSGSGKSRYFVMPNLAQAATSYVVTDPKGELLRSTGGLLADQGYTIRSLNLVDFAASDTFNPFAYINKNQPDVSLSALVENIITNTNGGKPAAGDQQFWERAERALLTSLAAYAYHTHGDKASLPLVADMLAELHPEDMDGLTDQLFTGLDAEATADPAKQAGLEYAKSQYGIYAQGAQQTRQSIVISLGIRLAPLHMAALRDLLCSNTVSFETLGTEKTALYLVTPDSNAAFDFLITIAYDQLFQTNMAIADARDDGRLEIPIQCFMDEFANVGRIPQFERKIAVIRSRGISVAPILQSYSQGKSIYKDDWETIVGNCDSMLFLGGQEKSTTEYVSKLIGKQTIDIRNETENRGQYGSYSISGQKTGRDLITPDELARLDNTECIYILRGVKPFKADKHDPIGDTNPYAYNPPPRPEAPIPDWKPKPQDDKEEANREEYARGDTRQHAAAKPAVEWTITIRPAEDDTPVALAFAGRHHDRPARTENMASDSDIPAMPAEAFAEGLHS